MNTKRIQAEDYDTGGSGVGYYDTTTGNSGGQYRSDNVDIEVCSEGGFNVGWIAANEWLKFSNIQVNPGQFAITMRVAAPSSGGTYYIEVNGVNVTGTKTISATGSYQTWATVTAGSAGFGHGNNTIRLVMTGAGWNVNWIEINRTGNNIVSNGSFENGFLNSAGLGWTKWNSSWSNTITFGSASVNKYDGTYSQYWARTDNLRFHGGVWQRVKTQSGRQYTITAWMKRQGNANDQWLEFGRDLTGGTDAEAGSVVYTKLEGLGYNVWVQYQQTVTATGDWMTIFGKAGTYNQSGNNNYFYLDAVSVVPVP